MTTPAGGTGQEPGGQQGAGQGQEPPANGTEGQEPQGQEQQQTASTDGQPAGQDGANQVDLSALPDDVRAVVERQLADAADARRQAARYRNERNAARDQVTEFQRANETAEQRAERERQEREQAVTVERERIAHLEQENRTLRVSGAIRDAARDAFNPDLVVQMLSTRVDLDDQGQPTNLQDLLGGLRQSDPYLFRRTSQDAGQGSGGSAPPGGMNDLIRSQVAARRGQTT